MHVLIYALQSSGATLLTLLLAQRPQTAAVLDAFNHKRIPQHATFPDECVIKATIPIHDAKEYLDYLKVIVQPSTTYLILRNPWCNYVSLKTKVYGDHIRRKFRQFNDLWRDRDADTKTLIYEKILIDESGFRNDLGTWTLPANAFDLTRTLNEIIAHTQSCSGWPGNQYQCSWGTGNVHIHEGSVQVNSQLFRKKISMEEYKLVQDIAPDICEHYRSLGRAYIDVMELEEQVMRTDQRQPE